MYESFSAKDYAKYLEDEFPGERKADFFFGKSEESNLSLNRRDAIYSQLESLSPEEDEKLKCLFKHKIIKHMRSGKSVLDGGDLANYVTNVPDVYQELIHNAVELSKDVESVRTEQVSREA